MFIHHEIYCITEGQYRRMFTNIMNRNAIRNEQLARHICAAIAMLYAATYGVAILITRWFAFDGAIFAAIATMPRAIAGFDYHALRMSPCRAATFLHAIRCFATPAVMLMLLF